MVIPENYAQINFRFAGPGAPLGAEMTLGLQILGFAGAPQEAAEVAALAFVEEPLTLMCDDIILDEVEVKFGPNATGPSATVVSGVAGSLTGACVSPQVSALIVKNTNLGGHQGKGRMYQPGVPESLVDSAGVLDSGYAGNLTSAWTSVYDDLVAADLLPALLRSEGSPIQTVALISSFTSSGKCATQRRRNRR